MAAHFDRLTRHLLHVANIRWLHSVADDFFTKQLPFNVTWVLTLMYALDQGHVANDPQAQVGILDTSPLPTACWLSRSQAAVCMIPPGLPSDRGVCHTVHTDNKPPFANCSVGCVSVLLVAVVANVTEL